MEPYEAAEQLEQLMVRRDALIPPASAARDSAEFRAFLAVEQKLGDFITEHEAELEPLRLPRDGMTAERYEATLGARQGTGLGWSRTQPAGPGGRSLRRGMEGPDGIRGELPARCRDRGTRVGI